MGSYLDLCQRPGCIHYYGEHEDAQKRQGPCAGLGRGPDGMMIPGTHCTCPAFTGKSPGNNPPSQEKQ